MARAHTHGHHRALSVAAPAPFVCSVCTGSRRVGVVRLDGMRGRGVVRCPHCSNSPHGPIPIYIYPPYQDCPGGDAA